MHFWNAKINRIHWCVIFYMAAYSNCEPFNPTVHCNCVDGRMSVTITTQLPYKGIVYTEDHRSDCYWLGQGSQEMIISMRLGGSDCGIAYNQGAENYNVILYVRQHATILLEQDRAFNLTCTNPITRNAAAQILGDDSIVAALRILDKDNTKTHETVFGEKYYIHLMPIESISYGVNFLVKSCRAFAGDYSATLIDAAGCSTDLSIISNIRYSESTQSAEASLNSMFRFHQANYVHFQCSLVNCLSSPCPRPNCDRRRDEPENEAEEVEFRGREILASTTVKISDIGNMTDIKFDAACSQYYSFLSWLCIIFAVVFILIICLHLAFCYICSSNGGDTGIVNEPVSIVAAFGVSACSESIQGREMKRH